MSTTRLTPLELAAGFPLPDDVAAPLPPSEARVEPLAAFQAVVRAALERPPCLVSFSGGRDSSAVLAVAADVARRDGLPLPIPATALFPGSAESDESDWQEQVVRGLGLDDWLRVDVDDGFDCV
ncbi:MAG TPA: asparagine synthase-related protein, partial [Gaiellaceae bacterium]|nr:asparagine synthase-related protein [Gaiellaceae bacterium]